MHPSCGFGLCCYLFSDIKSFVKLHNLLLYQNAKGFFKSLLTFGVMLNAPFMICGALKICLATKLAK